MKVIVYCMAAIAALTLHPAPASAKFELETGNDFLTHCSNREEPTFRIGICLGFLKGFIRRDELMSTGQAVCLPNEGVANGQIMDVVLRYLREYPAIRHKELAVLTLHALHEAFPCPQDRK